MKEVNKLRCTTPCKNNCLVLAYLGNPTDFPLARSMYSILGAYHRNYSYT